MDDVQVHLLRDDVAGRGLRLNKGDLISRLYLVSRSCCLPVNPNQLFTNPIGEPRPTVFGKLPRQKTVKTLSGVRRFDENVDRVYQQGVVTSELR